MTFSLTSDTTLTTSSLATSRCGNEYRRYRGGSRVKIGRQFRTSLAEGRSTGRHERALVVRERLPKDAGRYREAGSGTREDAATRRGRVAREHRRLVGVALVQWADVSPGGRRSQPLHGSPSGQVQGCWINGVADALGVGREAEF